MNKIKLVFATHNQYKLKEVQSLLKDFEIVSLAEINCFESIPETAATLEGNAAIKANYITEKYGLNCIADDTGLEVEVLNGEPGVFSARYAGKDNNSERNMDKLLGLLKNQSNRKAQFRTVIALNINGEKHLFEGICPGVILSEKQGEAGFGYDPIFKPNGYKKSFAEMTLKEKNAIGHRGIGIQNLIKFLKDQT